MSLQDVPPEILLRISSWAASNGDLVALRHVHGDILVTIDAQLHETYTLTYLSARNIIRCLEVLVATQAARDLIRTIKVGPSFNNSPGPSGDPYLAPAHALMTFHSALQILGIFNEKNQPHKRYLAFYNNLVSTGLTGFDSSAILALIILLAGNLENLYLNAQTPFRQSCTILVLLRQLASIPGPSLFPKLKNMSVYASRDDAVPCFGSTELLDIHWAAQARAGSDFEIVFVDSRPEDQVPSELRTLRLVSCVNTLHVIEDAVLHDHVPKLATLHVYTLMYPLAREYANMNTLIHELAINCPALKSLVLDVEDQFSDEHEEDEDRATPLNANTLQPLTVQQLRIHIDFLNYEYQIASTFFSDLHGFLPYSLQILEITGLIEADMHELMSDPSWYEAINLLRMYRPNLTSVRLTVDYAKSTKTPRPWSGLNGIEAAVEKMVQQADFTVGIYSRNTRGNWGTVSVDRFELGQETESIALP